MNKKEQLKAKLTILKKLLEKEKVEKGDLINMQSNSPETMDDDLIKQHEKTYINEVFSWDETVYDLLSIAYYNVGNKDLALYNVNEAIKINDNSERLQKNKKIIEQMK